MRIVFISLMAVALPAAAAERAKSVSCIDPATGERAAVKVRSIKNGLERVRRAMKRYGVHILDLPEAVRERHAHLPRFQSEENWCVLHSHVADIEAALETLRIDQGFVSGKFSRVERWMRNGVQVPPSRDKAERWLANAAAHMADGRYESANRLLNKVIGEVFGSSDTWKLPAELPESDAGSAQPEAPAVASSEVEVGCPALAKRGRATPADLQATVVKLRKLMDRKVVRPLDLKGGDELVADLESYTRLKAVWPATRIACAMIARVRAVEIDLGVVQKRFQRVKNLKEKRGIPAGAETRFKELVRNASRMIMAREYEPAHHELENLLVFLGEPSSPSAALH